MGIDTAALRALFTAGVAERPWSVIATVTGTENDADSEAVWVDVLIKATSTKARCRLGTPYSGPGYGLYVLPQVDAEVLVSFPSTGIPEINGSVHPDLMAGVVVCTLDNDGNKIPDGIDPATLLLVLAPSHKLVVKVQGGGTMLALDAAANSLTVTASSVDLNAASVKIHGGLITLADGKLPLARVGDSVVAGPFAGTITGPGNPLILG